MFPSFKNAVSIIIYGRKTESQMCGIGAKTLGAEDAIGNPPEFALLCAVACCLLISAPDLTLDQDSHYTRLCPLG